jgi:hypothetical protein
VLVSPVGLANGLAELALLCVVTVLVVVARHGLPVAAGQATRAVQT